jgi:Nif-specific regulatory protein
MGEPEAGLLEKVQGGTLLLDEVGELSTHLQSRLLHLLQNREFVRTGGGRPVRVDVRVIAASRLDLRERCEQGLFRASLFYRLRPLSITMPPLRARMEDVPGLFNHFRRRTADACGRDLYCTPEALELLLRHDWPGNVRELENIVERLVVMAEDGRVDERLAKLALAAEASSRPGGPGAHGPQAEGGGAGGGKPTLLEMERNEILLALSETGWIKRRAGKLLGLTERQIGYRIRKFGLDTKVAAERRRLRERRAS